MWDTFTSEPATGQPPTSTPRDRGLGYEDGVLLKHDVPVP